ncbi:hypothetical protein JGD43_25210 [Salmonella enterica subsp. enterica serovar Goldcoast]|nr:hypothetical protein [Salmonella enterica subsp. enterica serovar Goldcoast]
MQHGVQVAHGYARVEVDMVHEHFMAVPLEIRPNEEITTLGDAVHSFIQWPKTDIVLDPAVPQSRQDHSSPTGPSMTPPHISPQKATSLVSVEKTLKEQEKCATVSVPESSRRKTLPIVKAKSKSTNIKSPPKSEKPGKYSIRKPLCPDIELARAGFACQALHVWYMRKTGKKGCDTGITVAYKDEHFFNGTGNFVVGFNDLHELFNLVGLDASLLRCWTL